MLLQKNYENWICSSYTKNLLMHLSTYAGTYRHIMNGHTYAASALFCLNHSFLFVFKVKPFYYS